MSAGGEGSAPAYGNTQVQTPRKPEFSPKYHGFSDSENRFVSFASVDWIEFTLFNLPAADIGALWSAWAEDRTAPLPYVPEWLTEKQQARLWHLFGMQRQQKLERTAGGPPVIPFTVEMIPEFIGLPDCRPQKMPGGGNGYKARYYVGPVQVWADGGAPGMGLHVCISGAALEEVDEPLAILRRIYRVGGKVSRVDVAFDDFDGRLDLPKMCRAARAGKVVSRAQVGGIVESFTLSTGKSRGQTLYIGRRTSDVMWRIYDKRLEMLHEHKAPERLLPKKWVRLEGEFKGAAARRAAHQILGVEPDPVKRKENPAQHRDAILAAQPADLARWLIDTVNGNFSFRDPNKAEKKRERWPLSKWWKTFVDGAGENRVGRKIPKTTMEKRAAWFRKSCAPTMAAMMEAVGEREMMEIWRSGREKLKKSPKMKKEIDEYNRRLSTAGKPHRRKSCAVSAEN